MNIRALLQILLGEFHDKLSHLSSLNKREKQFPKAPGKIQVAIGMRRTGKTFFLYQHVLQLIQNGISKNAILYINLEDDRLSPLSPVRLSELVEKFYELFPENHDKKCYLFLMKFKTSTSGQP